MAFCENCGKQLNDGDTFCWNCGAKAVRIPSAPPAPAGASVPPVQPASPGPLPSGPSAPDTARGGGRMIRALISLGIAIALIIGVIVFFGIRLDAMDEYALTVSDKIRGLLDLDTGLSLSLGRLAVYGLALMMVLSAYILPARITGAILKTVTVMDKIFITIAGYFVIALCIFLKTQIFDQGLVGRSSSLIFSTSGGMRLKAVFLFIIILLLILIPVVIIIRSSSVLIRVVVNNIKVNGPVLGLIAAMYDLLSSVFVTAMVLCAASFTIAIILLPFLAVAASMSGKQIVYQDDDIIVYR